MPLTYMPTKLNANCAYDTAKANWRKSLANRVSNLERMLQCKLRNETNLEFLEYHFRQAIRELETLTGA